MIIRIGSEKLSDSYGDSPDLSGDVLYSGRLAHQILEIVADDASERIGLQEFPDRSALIACEGKVYLPGQPIVAAGPEDLLPIFDEFRRRRTVDFAASLDGSYRLALIDFAAAKVVILLDQAGTRPVYYYYDRDHRRLAAASSVKAILHQPGVRVNVSPGSVLSAISNGKLIGDATYFREIKHLLPAGYIEYTAGTGPRVDVYWRMDYDHKEPPPSAEELTGAICDAVERVLDRNEHTVLALSGGIDSRGILGALVRRGRKVPVITWGVDRIELPDGDFQLAERVARSAGFQHTAYRFDPDQLGGHWRELVELTDGMMLHIGAFCWGTQFAAKLAEQFDAILIGSNCFGSLPRARSVKHLFWLRGLRTGWGLRPALALMNPRIRTSCIDEYTTQCHELLKSAEGRTLEDTKDTADIILQVNSVIHVIHRLWRRHFEPACPMLDRRVLNLAKRLSPQQRQTKSFFKHTVETCLWPGTNVVLNTKHSRLDWKTRMRTDGKLTHDLFTLLQSNGDAFDTCIDRRALASLLNYYNAPVAKQTTSPEQQRPSSPAIKEPWLRFLWHRSRAHQLGYLAVVKLWSESVADLPSLVWPG